MRQSSATATASFLLSHLNQADLNIRVFLVRGQLLGRDIKPQLLPVVTIGGEVTLSGSDFENELRLGHSSRSNYFSAPPDPSLPTVYLFCALKRVLPDGLSGEYYWFATWTDDTIGNPDHWTHTASPEELHEFVVRATRHIAPELRNTIDLTPVNTFRGNPFPQRALVLPDMPTGRVTLLGDAAHCMPPSKLYQPPFRGKNTNCGKEQKQRKRNTDSCFMHQIVERLAFMLCVMH